MNFCLVNQGKGKSSIIAIEFRLHIRFCKGVLRLQYKRGNPMSIGCLGNEHPAVLNSILDVEYLVFSI